MSKIKKITVENLKAIDSLTADFNGCTAIITGKNNSGKTSFLRSLPDRLKSIKPDIILKEGTSEGFCEMELTTGEKFVWQFDNKTKKGEKLSFITKDNIKTGITKEISNRYFPKGFDIDSFLNESAKNQREMLQDIAGLDFTDIDNRYKSAYEDRANKNRDLKLEQAKLVEVDELLSTEEIDYLELQKEIAGIDSHNERFKGVESGMKERNASISNSITEIKRLQDLIDIENNKISTLRADIEKADIWINTDKNKPKSQEEADKLQLQVNDIIEINRKIVSNNLSIANKIKFDELSSQAKEADELVKSIENERTELIKTAKLPDGFGFTDEGITYNGYSFDRKQLSTSAIYIGALKLGALSIGEVKALHFDASYLDKNSLGEIEKWAHENDLQLLIERPDFDGGEIEYQLLCNH